MTATSIAPQVPAGSLTPDSATDPQMPPDYKKISDFGKTYDSLGFVCLLSDGAPPPLPVFLRTSPDRDALHSHTSRCDNSSCIRNPTPAAICLLSSVTMHWQFVFIHPDTTLMPCKNTSNQSCDPRTSF